MEIWKIRAAVLCLCVGVGSTCLGKVIYVDANAPGANDGSSWADAYNDLQDALADANASAKPVEIRVAQGIYMPDEDMLHSGGTGNREATFQLINGVTLKGGYAGLDQPDPNARDISLYETILSGDLSGDDVGDPFDPSIDDNCYHVVTGSRTDGTAVLEGFTITAGTAYGRDDDQHGGGVYIVSGSPTLSRCSFIRNGSAGHGGGVYNVSGSPTLVNCKVSGNIAGFKGGAGMYNFSGSPMLTNCTFSSNWAIYGSGGAMYNDFGSPTLINCVFTGNMRGSEFGGCVYCGGGGIYNDSSNPTLVNCVFSGNLSFNDKGGGICNFGSSSPILINCTFSGNLSRNNYGGGMYNDSGIPTVTNCIFWGNADKDGIDESAQIHTDGGTLSLNYSCIQGLTGELGGIGNVGDNALLMDHDGPDSVVGTEDDNLRLWPGSPCIDVGENSAVPPEVVTDLDGDSRIANGIVDMGAYEGPKQGFLLSTESVIIPEGGTAAFTVALAIDPLVAIAVTVAVKSGDPDITIDDGALLIFDSSNYAVPQVVTVAAAEDLDSITGSALALVSSPGLVTFGVTAIEGDNEPYPNTVVVDTRAPGANNGSSWVDAFTNLQDALRFAATHPEIVEIRVAQGIYRPAEPNGDRRATFQLINGVTLKGGYAGFGQPDPDVRDIEMYKTILSGDLDGDDGEVNPNYLMTEPTRAENSYHIVTGGGTDETAALDGFIVTGGNANGPGWPDEPDSDIGGGMYCNSISTMSNCTFIANSASWSGGGMYCGPNEGVSGTGPTLTNCRFIGNVAGNGGGMSASDINPTLIDCKFSNNLAINNGGGQDYGDCMPTLINCLFTGNSAYEDGGGMYCQFTYSMTLTNCTFSGNSSGNHGGGICDYYGLPALTNCILRGNRDNRGEDESAQIETWIPPVVNYSCIQGWTGVLGGTGNIGADPCFADPGYWDANGTPQDANDDFWVGGDYHLKSQAGRWDPNEGRWTIDEVRSPCIDAGDPMGPIGNEPFPNGGIINMGAYGGTAEASKSYFGKPLCETIVAGDVNGDCKVNFLDFRIMALHWMEEH